MGSIIKHLNILVADDHPVNLALMQRILQQEGANVYTAVNGVEVINQLNAHDNIQLAILDIQMPEMDGLECARNIRSTGKYYQSIPLFAISAGSSEHEKAASYAAGFNDYLVKPLKRDALEGILEAGGFFQEKQGGTSEISGQEMELLYLGMATQNNAMAAMEIITHAASSVPSLLQDASIAVTKGDYKTAASCLHKVKGVVSILEFKEVLSEIMAAENSLQEASAGTTGMNFDFKRWQSVFEGKITQAITIVSTW